MLHANLLPDEEKKNISFEQWIRVITFFGVAVNSILIIGITLLAPAYLPLYFQNRELERALSIQQQATQRISVDHILRSIAQIQAIITSLQQTADRPSSALSLFDLFVVPRPGIAISTFSVDKKAAVSLAGTAATRNNLLLFEQYLRDSARFQDITSPLTNIIHETNITFTFKATLKPNYAL